ncbi:TPR domain-containing protein [Daldinia sp. FL1419]|nr:TPR domain-containing protein [Daldinia sp. FL1419]
MLSASRASMIASSRSCCLHARCSPLGRVARSTSVPTQLQRVGTPSSEATSIRGFQQWRHQSSSSEPDRQVVSPPPSKVLIRALKESLSFRPLFKAFRGQSLRSLFRQSPEELVIAIILLCGAAGICVYVLYAYFTYFQSKQFTRFPPQIAKSLRRALYYSNYSPDAELALKYYKLALQQCAQAGLDPFSDEVMGLKIQLAAWFEKIGSYANSINVLESLLRDCKRWVEVMEKSVRDGLVDNSGRLVSSSNPQPPTAQEDTEAETKPENLWGKRTRVLGKSIGISVKLGQLFSDEHVLQGDSAGQYFVWAVETVLKELRRRQVEGVKEGEGDWMTPEQIGGALEALGNHYEAKSQHYLAAPLFLQAVSLSPRNSCHTAVLMNNLAISLAQQPITPPTDTSKVSQGSSSDVTARPTRSTLLASARAWALQAQETAQKVQGDDRTEECDEACAVALCNLGDIAVMTGDTEEARRRFKESLSLSKKIAFDSGVVQAEEGLQRLSKAAPKKST